MKAAYLSEIASPFIVGDAVIDAPIGREVLVDVKAVGLCHSDVHLGENDFGFSAPIMLGHEVAGVVAEIGPDVAGLQVGDHVVACLITSCGHCNACARGYLNACRNGRELYRARTENPRVSINGEAVSTPAGMAGFAEQALIHENQLVAIDKSVPFDRAALLGCGVLTGAGAISNSARVRSGETVAVIGCGGVGLNAIQMARITSAERIIAVDLQPGKLELARDFGATDVIHAGEVDPVAAVKEITGGLGVDHALEVIGLVPTVEQALGMLTTHGTAYLVGIQRPGATLDLNIDGVGGPFLQREHGVRGVWMGSSNFRVDVPKLAELYLQGRLKLDELVSRTISLADINTGFDELKTGTVARNVIAF
ncbi:Zn-dependent alcohol dehydrogenase [Brevibacterium jeotgali]|uniref:S-(Hydroxymethyl)glutathione dehydrogenase / alcohol dehydrogenase n=1 Tax=Brevibacterium jeotgali TaxID=1262550 RepID=A0A2H1L8B2_9MICO|nr:Zn-dependent alcohol dehydrogenase [Brevibacterium jeotgali]TWC02325.1 S-(hydroxymethyl)glutathione dehydrogenase/alcohol dehydrogenase [Brevibacterium jeotgali]SMY12623.1 S-(hydroxymethyl)glutathione dehydrogenase / alcohol dehydrogenase [Brevibacterium jeotgali]